MDHGSRNPDRPKRQAPAARRVRHGPDGYRYAGDPGARRGCPPPTVRLGRRLRDRLAVLPAGRTAVARGGRHGFDQLATALCHRLHDLRAVSHPRHRRHRTVAAFAESHAGAGRAVPVRAAIHCAVIHRVDLDRPGQRRRSRLCGDCLQPGRSVDHAAGVRLHVARARLPFIAGHLVRPWIGAWAARNRALLAVTDRGSILLVVYTAFSAAVVHGIWQQLPPAMLGALTIIVAGLLAAALLITRAGARACGFMHADEVAAVFCGSQKSLVAGIPIASVLFAGPTLGVVVLPIMLYHPMQLVVCAWLARRFAKRVATARASVGAALPIIDAA